MKILISFLLATSFSWTATAQSEDTNPIDTFVNSYPSPSPADKRQGLTDIAEVLGIVSEDYQNFYADPKDINDPEFATKIARDQAERRNSAQQAILDLFELRPEEQKLILIQMLTDFLEKPEKRPALREIYEAFEILRNSDEVVIEESVEQSWQGQTATGATVGFFAGAVACITKPQMCSEVWTMARRGRQAITRGSGQAVRSAVKSGNIDPAARARALALEKIEANRRTIGLGTRVVNPMVGTALRKAHHVKDYIHYKIQGLWDEFKVLTLFVGGGAAANLGLSKIKESYISDEMKEQYLNEDSDINASSIAENYYTPLAILELSCQVRSYLEKDADLDQAQNFVIEAYDEFLLLGKMSGTSKFLERTQIGFVQPKADGGGYTFNIPIPDEDPISGTIPCSGVNKDETQTFVSGQELETLFANLVHLIMNPPDPELEGIKTRVKEQSRPWPRPEVQTTGEQGFDDLLESQE